MARAARFRRVGRYEIGDEFARGGMASVHIGRLVGPVGFARTVAIKVLHPAYASDPTVVRMFIDEARISAWLRHPNVVPIVDVVAEGGSLYLVMDYVRGVSLARIQTEMRGAGDRVPLGVVSAIMADALAGLHAAHEAVGEAGERLDVVHRDVSPQNLIVGDDGVARILDFGVAKAASRLQETAEGQVKGKLAYMSPEQLAGRPLDRRCDVFAASVVSWELLTGKRLFAREDPGATVAALTQGPIDPPSAHAPGIDDALDAVVLRGLSRDPDARWASALDMARALEAATRRATPFEVAQWLADLRVRRDIVDTGQLARAAVEEASVGTAPAATASGADAVVERTAPMQGAASARAQEPSGGGGDARRRPRRGVAWVAAASGLVVIATAAAAWESRAGRAKATASPAVEPTATATATALASEPAAPSASPDETAGTPSPASSGSASAAPVAATAPARAGVTPGATSATGRARSGHARPHAAPPRTSPSGRTDCRVVDPDGTFSYKPECLR